MADEIKPTRATRRVLLVLLTGAPELDDKTVSYLAGTRAYRTLHRLERAGWVTGEWGAWVDMKPRYKRYRLTRQGWAKATLLLGLPADERSVQAAGIDDLRGFEREYRARLAAYLRHQLQEVEGEKVPGA